MSLQVTKGNDLVLEGKQVEDNKKQLGEMLARRTRHLGVSRAWHARSFWLQHILADWQRGAPEFMRSFKRKLIFKIEVEFDFIFPDLL